MSRKPLLGDCVFRFLAVDFAHNGTMHKTNPALFESLLFGFGECGEVQRNIKQTLSCNNRTVLLDDEAPFESKSLAHFENHGF